MNHTRALAALATAACLSATAQAGVVTTDGADIIINTKSGLEVKTTDGEYSFKIGGRVQLDGSGWDGVTNKGSDDWGSDVWFRRARIEAEGKAGEWGYLMSYNLTDSGSIDLAWIEYNGWGEMARVVMGQQKEDFGLDDTGSSKWITFTERALPANAFETGNNVGIKLTGANDSFTYSVGAYKEGTDAKDNSLDVAYTGRVVYRPLFSKDGDVIHIGAGVTHREGEFDAFESRLARGGEGKKANKVESIYLDGTAKEQDIFNLEALAQFGSFHAMGEYFKAEASDNPLADDMEADGFYIQAGYFLTGEHRSYKTASGAFDKVKPNSSSGAWEVAVRYDELDVSNNDPLIKVSGEVGNSYTLGVNWYATPLVRVMADYSYVEVDKEINNQDDGNVFSMRAQYAF